MISQGVRLALLIGLLVSALTAPETLAASSSTEIFNRQTVICGPGPDC